MRERFISPLILLRLAVGLPVFGGTALPRARPEAAGIDSRHVFSLVHRLETKIDAVHSLMLVRHPIHPRTGFPSVWLRASVPPRESLLNLS